MAETPASLAPSRGHAISTLQAGVDEVSALNLTSCTPRERINLLAAVEHIKRKLDACEDAVAATIYWEGDHFELAAPNAKMLVAEVLRITPAEAGRRIEAALELTESISVSGAVCEPRLPGTAEVRRLGLIGTDHLRIIRRTLHLLPHGLDYETKVLAEKQLAQMATQLRPDELQQAADKLLAILNPDGDFSDEDRKRHRFFTMSKPDANHLTYGKFCIGPELRAYLDAAFAIYAAPGVNNADDHDAANADGAAQRDARSVGQRQHDAVELMAKRFLDSSEHPSHRGIATTVVITATLEDLRQAEHDCADGHAPTGFGYTGGGQIIPMSDLLQMAQTAITFLLVSDQKLGRPLWLGRMRRLASARQRLAIFTRDRGCTFPGCTAPAIWCELHHIIDWVLDGPTNPDNLALVCPAHHRLVTAGKWRTTLRDNRCHWEPPQESPYAGGTNHYWHPEEYLGPPG